MEENEHILDSGEIYKDPKDDTIFELNTKPIAVDWSTTKDGTRVFSGGYKYKTHNLIATSDKNIKFVPTLRFFFKDFFSFFIGIFFILLGLFFLFLFSDLTVASLIAITGIVMIANSLKFKGISIATFNVKNNKYRKGGKEKVMVDLSEIEAIQLLREYVLDRYYSYEINIVLKNGDRLNVIDHGNKKAAEKQADYLANFLNVPLLTLKDDRYKRDNG